MAKSGPRARMVVRSCTLGLLVPSGDKSPLGSRSPNVFLFVLKFEESPSTVLNR